MTFLKGSNKIFPPHNEGRVVYFHKLINNGVKLLICKDSVLHPAGFEPATLNLEGCCSIQLS
jgi:hypothetical protein